ncbi:hypothetical protein CBR_g40517 [Chara braunii]|uniref:Uncharacterized protein n=1 Tax=Chara braunii TaxID=69332 RepID=A0A388K1Y4_CHABU|nr:hypothetical protein CBR_g40517 [Chara braunii]|eukprot:GBG64071.1 hypothetical protein CBR_g40517 [Chara braunii]
MSGDIVYGAGKVLTIDDLVEALGRRERLQSNIAKVNTFHFNMERVSKWLELVEQALVGLSDAVKFQRILKYVLHGHHQEVDKVINATNDSWARFKDGIQRKYRLGDGLLTTADPEAMNRDDFTIVGAFVQEFKKKVRKVHGVSEEVQCVIFLRLLTASEASELTSHGGGSVKLTWATIDKGVEEGSLDQGNQENGGRGSGRGRGRNGGGRGGQWDNQGYQGQGNQGSQGNQGGQGYGRPRFDWRTDICQHCDKQGHMIRFCNIRREDEKSRLIYSNINGDIYDQFGEYIDRKVPGRVRAEAHRRIAARQAPPPAFRLWEENDDPPIKVEEVEYGEEVTQRLSARTIEEEPMVVESEEENKDEKVGPASILIGKMKDLWKKIGRYQLKLVDICETVKSCRAGVPKVFLYESGLESMPGRPGVAAVGSGLRYGMMVRPPMAQERMAQERMAQAARTRGQAKASASQEPPRKESEPEKRKEVVEVEDEEEEDEQDERLRQEEDQRAEQRAKKRGSQEEAELVLRDAAPRKKKYAVRLEEGFDVERIIHRLLEGHNDLVTLKEILTSAPKLHNELKGRLSRRLVRNVHLSVILPKEAEWAETGTKMDWKCVACGRVDLVVKGFRCAAMVDTGVEMNIIKEADAVRFRLEIDRSDCDILHGANCKAVFCGTTSNVLIEIWRMRVRACFFVMPDVDHAILLGRFFLCRTETLMFNKHDETLILILCDPTCENYEIIICRNADLRSIRNRPNPDSFTIEESEDERRKLREESTEEAQEELFSLSLSDVNKAMDVVATHEMADPYAIQALREQVLECPQAGELKLVYRLPGGRRNLAIMQVQAVS